MGETEGGDGLRQLSTTMLPTMQVSQQPDPHINVPANRPRQNRETQILREACWGKEGAPKMRPGKNVPNGAD